MMVVISMDETIGVKGGKNDRRRSMIISRENKKKLEEYEEQRELQELEQKVRKQQIYTLIKTLPIVVGGEVIKTFKDTAEGKRPDKEIEESKWRIKEYNGDVSSISAQEENQRQVERRRKVIVTPTGEKMVVYIEVPLTHVDEKPHTNAPQEAQPLPEVKEPTIGVNPPTGPIGVATKPVPVAETKPPVQKGGIVLPTIKKGVPTSPEEDTEFIDVESFVDHELPNIDFSELSPEALEKLDKLKARKIIDEYERQLKDIRYDLRNVIYEYNVLVDSGERMVVSKDAEIILDRLSDIITKVEELKKKIRIEDLDKYDDNYIYFLIEGYLQEFKDKKLVDEIKDSPLYVLIANKLDELEKKRDSYSSEVEDKKEELEVKEKDFEQLKDKYYSIEQLNDQLLEFQYEQDRLLREIQDRVRNATTETERVTEEFQGLTRQSRNLLRMLSFHMFLPGPRFAKGLAAGAAAYLYFMNNVIRPNTVTRRYRVITVKDYSRDIEDSIHSLDDAMRLLGKTSDQIDKMISEIQVRYHDYFGVVKECDELLQNLKKVKSEVEEKEYEMKRLKKQQELELEKNNAKVKTIGEYPVN